MNLNYLFNVKYYSHLHQLSPSLNNNGELEFNEPAKNMDKKNDPISKYNNDLISSKFLKSDNKIEIINQSFTLKTMYPGLLLGLGNSHESKCTDSEIKLGFNIDYVTGLPIILGSTIKGVLRSAFRKYPQCVQELLGITDENKFYMAEYEIFGEFHPNDENKSKSKINFEKEPKGIDTFFDAIPVKAGKDNRIYGLENITPHMSEDPKYDGLIEPKPLTLLKVIPNVVYLFQFDLKDGIVTSDQKLKCFKELFIFFGIGAKTNVGFGYMEDATFKEKYTWLETVNTSEDPPITNSSKQTISKEGINTKERINCPHCGSSNYKYNKHGIRATKCYKCNQNL